MKNNFITISKDDPAWFGLHHQLYSSHRCYNYWMECVG